MSPRFRPARLLLALAFLSVLLLAGCSSGGNTTSGGTPVITYTFPTFATLSDSDVQAVQNAMNAIIKPQINATIKLEPESFGTYSQKEPLALSTGTTCDIVFTAPWVNNYYQDVASHAFLALDSLLPKDAPQLYASLPASIWNAARVNGHIYGVINDQILTKPWGIMVRKDLATRYNLNLNNVNSFADLSSFFAEVKAGSPGVTPLYTSDNSTNSVTFHPETVGWDPLSSSLPLAIRATDPTRQVFNETAQPEFEQYVQQMYEWHQAGYTTKTPSSAADQNQLLQAGKYAAQIAVIKPGGDAAEKASNGYDWIQKSLTTPLLDTDAAVATLNSVCASSPNPDKALQILNLLNTNKDLYNLICHGIEGKNYTFVDKAQGVIAPVANNNGYNPGTDWMFGNQFNGYYTDPAQVGSWPATEKLNQSATISTALGFSFDQSSVQTQVAQVTAALTQYEAPLLNGLVNPATGIPQLEQALKQAGIDSIQAAMQQQINAWAQANK